MTAAARDEKPKITRAQKTVYCFDGHEYPTLDAAAEVAADDDLDRVAATLEQSMFDLPVRCRGTTAPSVTRVRCTTWPGSAGGSGGPRETAHTALADAVAQAHDVRAAWGELMTSIERDQHG